MGEAINDDPFDGGTLEGPAEEDFLVVGLGASAGGVAALREFFAHVPAESGMAYVVILHLSPEHESRLAEVLRQTATIPVVQITERVRVEPNRIYIVSPNQSLSMQDGQIAVSEIKTFEERRAPVDIFFGTLADSHRTRAVCVVLSGTGPNGSTGLKRVKEMGGAAYVQDPNEAEYDDMPRHSLATGLVDYALPVGQIPAKIIGYRDTLETARLPSAPEERKEVDELALRDIFTQLRVRTGHDFSNYKRATVLRRIARRMSVQQLPDLEAYARFMLGHPSEVSALLGDLLISVTNFFRDPKAFEKLESDIVPKLFEGKGAEDHVRVWVAGCATGEEAYSVAMLLHDYAAGKFDAPQIQVFATDIDERAIAVAREGWYTQSDVADIPPTRLNRYFHSYGEGFRIRREMRESVLFAVHNILKDPPFAHLDLVTCRNLSIYLNRTAQTRVMEVLHFALNSGGYLMLGSSETTEQAGDLFIPVDKELRIYQSRAIETRVSFPIPQGTLALRLSRLPEARHIREAPASERYTYADMHQRLLERYAPPSLVVNEEYDILHMSESAGRYLEIRGGDPTYNLLKLVRPELRLELRAALYQALQDRNDVETHDVTLHIGDEVQVVSMRVMPVMRDEDPARGFILVIFKDKGVAAEDVMASAAAVVATEPVARQLEEELMRVKEQLNATVEQHELQREELKASNEELQAMNEELRSAAEELETSKEELQSINEELTTVNQELKVKIDELSHAKEDVRNLMNSTEFATVFLDQHSRIKLFTPRARDIFNLIPSDIGRPLTDISNRLGGEDLIADTQRVLESMENIERVVETNDGRSYLMRILPYRATEREVEGTSISFTDITERIRAEEALRKSEALLRKVVSTQTVGALFFSLDGRITDASDAFVRMSGYSRDELLNMDDWSTLTPPEFMEATERAARELAERGETAPYEKQFIRKDGSRWWGHFAPTRLAGSGPESQCVEFIVDITEHKRAEEALAASEARMQAIANLVPDLLWSNDPTGYTDWYNRSWLEYTGQTLEEARGYGWLKAIHPDDRDNSLRDFQTAVDEGRPLRQERRIRRHDGQYRWFFFQARPVRDEAGTILRWYGAATDIHDERTALEQLRDAEERLRRMMDSITDYAIITLDPHGYIESWNSGAQHIFGFTQDEALGQHTELIFTREDRRRGGPVEEMRLAREHGRAADERWHVRKDGSRIYLSGVLSSLGDSASAGYVKIARDLTEQKRAEEELRRVQGELEDRVRERTQELAQANDSLREEISERIHTERARVRLLRQIVRAQEDERRRIARDIHDQLGQQMTALRLNLDSISQACGEDEEMRRKLQQTQAIAERLDADVDFLAWELRPAALDDLGLLEALRNFVREWSRHAGVEAEFHTMGMESERLAPEAESALYRITQEALNNAQKYARASRVDVLLERRDQQVVLIVEDDGVGFNPQREVSDGKGLGLVGMRERALLVGGTLEIESKPDEGTTVFARVPVKFLEEEGEE